MHALTVSQNEAYPLTMATVTLTVNSGGFPARLCVPQKKKAFAGQIFLAPEITVRLSNKYWNG